MNNIKHAAEYVGEKAQEVTRGTSKEVNKDIAKDSNVPIGDRAHAAKGAVGDKFHEEKHSGKASGHKELI